MTRQHAWSHDPARDAAVRAAEDGRDRPLPTRGEAIAAVTKSMSENRIGEDLEQGMRTERVTLEITYNPNVFPPTTRWAWESLLRLRSNDGESVRVVEETHFDDVARVAMERDAAIRERESWRMLADRLHARVAELEADQLSRTGQIGQRGSQDEQKCTERDNRAASGGGEGEPVAWGVFVRGRIDEYAGSEATFIEKEMADEWAGDHRLGGEGIVAPLYRVPPQPRGWLTEDERNAVEFLASLDAPPCVAEARQAARIGKELLARSSPPEVVKPGTQVRYHSMSVEDQRDAQWIAAIAKAGVPVKEVPNG